MQLKEVKEELNKFGQFVIQQARSRLGLTNCADFWKLHRDLVR